MTPVWEFLVAVWADTYRDDESHSDLEAVLTDVVRHFDAEMEAAAERHASTLRGSLSDVAQVAPSFSLDSAVERKVIQRAQ
jgi:hypothetical protein